MHGRMDDAAYFLNLPDYFHYRLTGVKKQEYTMATTTGMVNASSHTWDREIIQKLGYKDELFGEISMPGTLVGAFTDEIAQAVGYSPNALSRVFRNNESCSPSRYRAQNSRDRRS